MDDCQLLRWSVPSRVNEHISSTAGLCICDVDFEQNNHVLGVRLSGKGAVLCLGTPQLNGKNVGNASIEHGKSKAGLKHTFLDCSLLGHSAILLIKSLVWSARKFCVLFKADIYSRLKSMAEVIAATTHSAT